MARSAYRHVLTVLSLAAIGPMAGSLVGGLRLPDGAVGATALTSESPVRGLVLLSISLLVAGATGVVASRIRGWRHGMLCAGFVVAWVAWRQATIEETLIHARDGGPLVRLAIEGAFAGGAACAIGWAVRAADRRKRRGGEAEGEWSAVTVGVIAAAAVATVGAHVVAVEPLKGQAVFAAFVGSVLAGGASWLAMGGEGGGRREPPARRVMAPLVGIALVAAGGPVAAVVVHGTGLGAAEAAFAGRILRVATVGPSDWAAGALLGVPVGMAWAASLFPRANAVERAPERA